MENLYIGQTTNFRKRLSDYRNLHKKKSKMTIAKAIKEYGTDNFTIEIVQLCEPEELTELENYYIRKFNTSIKTNGYNLVTENNKCENNELSRKRKSESHKGIVDSDDTKRKKSNAILAFKDGKLLVCDSGKLFGDYVGVSKDMIKNGLRQPSKICGYRLYYDDYWKRQEIREKMKKKRSIRDKGYIEVLDVLDNVEIEGVETIYYYFSEVNYLKYADNGKYRIVPIDLTTPPPETEEEKVFNDIAYESEIQDQ